MLLSRRNFILNEWSPICMTSFRQNPDFFLPVFNNLTYTTKTAASIIIFLYKRNKITHYKWLIALRLHNCNAKKHSWKIVTKNTSTYYIQSRVMQLWRERTQWDTKFRQILTSRGTDSIEFTSEFLDQINRCNEFYKL